MQLFLIVEYITSNYHVYYTDVCLKKQISQTNDEVTVQICNNQGDDNV